MKTSKAQNVRVSLNLKAIKALREIVDSTPDLTDKEAASRAILAYHRVWRAKQITSRI